MNSLRKLKQTLNPSSCGRWFCTALSTGCGGTLYAVHAGNATARWEEAKAMGAMRLAPYEYHLADEHLKKASEEASRAEYSDALELLRLAEAFAEQAIQTSRAVAARTQEAK
jgi:Domain of unknown function (DUF4398)